MNNLYIRENGDTMPVNIPVPKQVLFVESEDLTDEPRWIAGIAFGEYVICGECGATIELRDLDKLYIFKDWVDIAEFIGDWAEVTDIEPFEDA